MALLNEGIPAPDFALKTTPDQKVALSEFRGKKVILVFYPGDWSPVCGDELALFNEIMPIFKKHNVELLGISVDSPWSHIAFEKSRKLKFNLLSDFEPKGDIARKFQAYRNEDGTCERALYLIDEQGIIRWSHLSPVGINPGAEGLLDALEKLNENTQEPTDEKKAS